MSSRACVTLQSQNILETGRQNENVNLDSTLWPRRVSYVQEYFFPFLDFLLATTLTLPPPFILSHPNQLPFDALQS